jgi:hypothetical protein
MRETYNCIMEHALKYTKANMTSAAEILGLSILTLGGWLTLDRASSPRFSTSERLVLVILLAQGSPAINFIRALDYHDLIEELHETNPAMNL